MRPVYRYKERKWGEKNQKQGTLAPSLFSVYQLALALGEAYLGVPKVLEIMKSKLFVFLCPCLPQGIANLQESSW